MNALLIDMILLLSKTYEIVTEESAELGDAADRGYEYEDRETDVHAVIRELRTCSELSQSPVSPTDCAHVWASTEPEQDYRTGDYTSYSYFIKHANGQPLSSRQLYRLYRVAGLVRR